MEFLRFLETEDLKGSSTEEAMSSLAASTEKELTEEQHAMLAKEFPGLWKKSG